MSAIAFISFEWFLLYHTLGKDALFFFPTAAPALVVEWRPHPAFFAESVLLLSLQQGVIPLDANGISSRQKWGRGNGKTASEKRRD
ncbi:hypothetical protein QT235_11980 [Geobacillus stearothermophilus]|nr:hypothetical protein QT235_11980 [Geobacillus stearothermophilus]